jgi:predicted nucleic acid-binding protein
MIVLDTNVLSEALRPTPSDVVLRWLASQDAGVIFTTAITRAELLHGVELLPAGKRRTRLYAALENLLAEEFRGRILPFDADAAREYPKIVAGREAIGRPMSQFDAVIAAVCRSRSASIATRNAVDFAECGLSIINPWQEPAGF